MNYKFVLLDNESGQGKAAWVLPLPVTVGRSEGNQIVIGHPSISRRHCQFFNDPDGALVVRDFDSMNGLYVEEQRVKRSVLRPGIVIQIGGVSMRVEWTNDPITENPVTIDASGNVTQPLQRSD